MTSATMVKEDDLRDKIKTVMSRLDTMESRVKDVETTTAAVSRLESKLAHVIERVEKVESRVDPSAKPKEMPKETPVPQVHKPAPPPVKAFISGVSMGLLLLGLIVAAWLLF